MRPLQAGLTRVASVFNETYISNLKFEYSFEKKRILGGAYDFLMNINDRETAGKWFKITYTALIVR